MKTLHSIIILNIIIVMITCGCDRLPTIETAMKTPLEISVSTIDNTKGAIKSGYFPINSNIGVWVVNESSELYENIKYSTTSSSLTASWSPSVNVYLDSSPASIYAIYPYIDKTDIDINAVEIDTASQIDWMWSQPINGICNTSPYAKLFFRHALCTVTIHLNRGSYSGDGYLTSLEISSESLGTTAVLDATNGALSDIAGTGDFIESSEMPLTIADTGSLISILAIPSGNEGEISVKMTIDGILYTITSPSVAILQGENYTINVTINDTE